MSRIKLALDVVHDLRALADSLEVLANAVASGDPDTQDAAAQQEEAPKLTIVELRAFVAERSTPENRPKIKAILTKFGVNKLTELKEEQYVPLMKEVAALD